MIEREVQRLTRDYSFDEQEILAATARRRISSRDDLRKAMASKPASPPGGVGLAPAMKLFANQLDANLERGLAPVYLIAGPELLLVEEACDAIRKRARRDTIDERVVLDADARFDWNQLGATGDTMSLFASRRLIELRLPSGKSGREGAGALRDWVKKRQ